MIVIRVLLLAFSATGSLATIVLATTALAYRRLDETSLVVALVCFFAMTVAFLVGLSLYTSTQDPIRTRIHRLLDLSF